MGEMRNRMEKELKLRGYSPRTIKTYLRVIHNFVAFHRRPAEKMGSAEARSYLLHLIEDKHLTAKDLDELRRAVRKKGGAS